MSVRTTNNHTEAAAMDAIGVLNTNPLDDYELIHRIGSGTYGDVFKVFTDVFYLDNRLISSLLRKFAINIQLSATMPLPTVRPHCCNDCAPCKHIACHTDPYILIL